MTGPWRAGLALLLTTLVGAAGSLVAPAAAALLPAVVGGALVWTVLRCFRAGDPQRPAWLALAGSAEVAALAILAPTAARPFVSVLAAALFGGAVLRLYRRLAASPLAGALTPGWTVAAVGLGLGVAVLAGVGEAAWDLRSPAAWVAHLLEGATRSATAVVAVRLFGLAVPLCRGAAGPPLAALAGAALVSATQLLAGEAPGSWAQRIGTLGGWLGWVLLGLAGGALWQMRRQTLALLTAARERVILQRMR